MKIKKNKKLSCIIEYSFFKGVVLKTIEFDTIKNEVARLCIKMCCEVTPDILKSFNQALKQESSDIGKHIIESLLLNARIAKEKQIPICQDTGTTVVFVELGNEVYIKGGLLDDAINEGVRLGYTSGYLRKSIVKDPLFERVNTNDNTPAVINLKIVKGEELKIKVCSKGAGSENKSTLKMLTPADGIEGVKNFFLETLKKAGPNSCPPLVIGVGIGGNLEKVALMAKFAAVRGSDSKNPDPRYEKFENELLELANKSGIGPQGFGGDTTALKVNVEVAPTHIASLPVAININCHAARHYEVRI